MKTIFFKIIIPITVIIFAIYNSFASNISEKNIDLILSGYIIPIGNTICQNITTCSSMNPTLCSVVYQGQTYQVYGKQSPSDTVCDIPLYRQNP